MDTYLNPVVTETAESLSAPPVQENEQTRHGSHIIRGAKARWIKRKFRFHILKLAFKHYGVTKRAFNVLEKLGEKQKQVHGEGVFNKWVRAGGKYYYYQYAPGYPSRQLDEVLLEEMNRIEPVTETRRPLRFAFFAITKKCPLKCEHCFEWDNINKKEMLGYEDLRTIVSNLLDAGITQLHLSGGEPMLRVHELVKLSEEFSERMEIWVLTSGFNGTERNILELKMAGVTGLVVSVDHYDREKHDAFRRHTGSYDMALQAIQHARKAGMPVAVSVCATKEFCEEDNLDRYLEFMHQLDVSFIQLLEPRAVGGYAGKEVALEETQLQRLTDFYEKVNFSSAYEKYPVVVYHGYYQRRVGCFLAGNRALYVDTNGGVTACPFCQNISGNLLKEPVLEVISKLKERGCSSFGSSVV